MGFGFFNKETPSISELQEENEKKDLELSIAQKQAMMLKLNQAGLSVKKDFGGNLKAAWQWFRTH